MTFGVYLHGVLTWEQEDIDGCIMTSPFCEGMEAPVMDLACSKTVESMCFAVTQILKICQLVPMTATPEDVKDQHAEGFLGIAADCGGENINKNTVDASGLLDGGMFGKLFVTGPQNARRPKAFFISCGNHGVNNADQATCLSTVHTSATTAVKFLRQGLNFATLKPVARFIAGVCVCASAARTCVSMCVCVCICSRIYRQPVHARANSIYRQPARARANTRTHTHTHRHTRTHTHTHTHRL